jgi:tryptophan synthase alpha chain
MNIDTSLSPNKSIKQLLENKKEPLLSVFFTAGYPKLNDTLTILDYLEKSGVDWVEIGIPFSDPIADGETIQQSSSVALENGMNLNLLFEQLKSNAPNRKIPVILMGYFNTVFQYGVEQFCIDCQASGVSGAILPDLTPELFSKRYADLFRKHQLIMPLIITPETQADRIKHVDEIASGFLYLVSASGTTGKTNGFDETQLSNIIQHHARSLKNPIMVGFGISNHQDFQKATQKSRGAIVGSAFIRHINQYGIELPSIQIFVKNLKNP